MTCFRTLLASFVVLAAVAAPPAVLAQTGMPTQTQTDGAVIGTTTAAGWGALAGGATARPYVARLTSTVGGVETVLIGAGTTAPPATTTGQPTVVISPSNLCASGQAPAQGTCYATPNRIGITLGKPDTNTVDQNLTGAATAETVFDMTVNLNTLGQTLRWSWANLDLLYWSTSGLGTPGATLSIRFRPVVTPTVATMTGNEGCTSTPIGSFGPCSLPQATSEILAASITLSLDDTVNTSLTGAIFATQGAIFGYLNPTGTSSAPVLDLQMAAPHLRPDGSLQTGVMKALLPAQSLLNIYGVLPADAATFFTTTRTAAAGSQSAPVYSTWTAGAEGSDGLLITISDITFSAPTYAVKRKAPAAKSTVQSSGSRTTVAIKALGPCKAAKCTATLYTVSSAVSGKATKVGTVTSAADGSMSLVVAKAKMKRGTSWSVAIRLKKGGKLVTTAAGVNGGSLNWGSSSGGSGGGGNGGGSGGGGSRHR